MSKINWKPLCKFGCIFGVLGVLINWTIYFTDKFFCLDGCQSNFLCCFIELIWFIFSIPVLILFTIIFGPLGDRIPFLFHDPQGLYKIITEVIGCVCTFITYFFIYVLAKIIYNNKTKIKKEIRKSLSLKNYHYKKK